MVNPDRFDQTVTFKAKSFKTKAIYMPPLSSRRNANRCMDQPIVGACRKLLDNRAFSANPNIQKHQDCA